MLAPGIYPDISNQDYHKLPYVSNSMLSKINKCPAAAWVKSESTDYFTLGSATHSLILEGPQAFSESFCVVPQCDRRTKEGKMVYEQFELANEGKDIISADDYNSIVGMRESVMSHPFSSTLLAQGVSEQSVIWEDAETEILCKCRPDRIPAGDKGVLVDLKTTQDAGERAFTRSCVSYGYAMQAAFYLDGVTAATGKQFDAFAFVVVEKTEPYRVECYLLDSDFIAWGRREYRRLLEIYRQCKTENSFPNYQSPTLNIIFKPNYL